MKADNPFDLLLPAAMAKVAEEAGVYKATKHPMKTFYLAITAGVFISIAFVFYITATTGTAAMPYGIAKLIGGICFSLGLILCVICGADLFTSTAVSYTHLRAHETRHDLVCRLLLEKKKKNNKKKKQKNTQKYTQILTE